MTDLLQKIDDLRQRSTAELAQVSSAADLEKWRIKFLGSNGEVKLASNLIKLAQGPDKKAIGQAVNTVKQEVQAAFDVKKAGLASEISTSKDYIDVTEPGLAPAIGRTHVMTQVTNELTDLFARMGFAVAAGPEVEDDFHNFVALNIPASHPARDPLDNFYLTTEGSGQTGTQDSALRTQNSPPEPSTLNPEPSPLLLRTQTSTVQIRVMEHQKPPIRVVIPGKVYRPDTMDATHLPMFHQLEALVVDRNVTMVDLKSTILQFVHAYFGADTQVRFRPSFFPFTEPSAEVDVWFPDKQKWIELGGCGMVHPNVLKVLDKHGLNPDDYTGWAFGFGIERIAMRKYGIPDIRMLIENDLRFLRQF
ncbi:MAG: phenylalanine--tRNA ligase subunit alpha [Phycisphaerae bacterium]|nr:phenylalanine--tRNA ligase subunit alpha [Tepidisphaeraceae bacterium]